MGWLCLLAQSQPNLDSLTGGAGWVGAGLLGLVLAWLLFVRMPAWDKLMNEKDERHTQVIREITKAHDETFAKAEIQRRADFQVAITTITDSHTRNMKNVVDHCEREITTLREINKETSAVVVDLRMALEEMREVYLIKGTAKKNG